MNEKQDADGLTLTYWTVDGRDRRFRSAAEAQALVGPHRDLTITPHTQTYRKGDEVEVHAYGAWRPGKVVVLKRTRVIVHFQRNKHGRIGARTFDGSGIRPRGGKEG